MALLEVKQPSPEEWQLTGELTFASLSQAYKKLQMQRPHKGAWHLNCQAIQRIDSAGVAYLLDCIRYSEQQGLKLQIAHLPDLARSLMQAQGVAKLIVPQVQE